MPARFTLAMTPVAFACFGTRPLRSAKYTSGAPLNNSSRCSVTNSSGLSPIAMIEIELPSAILQAQKLSERGLIIVLRKPPLVDELGVIVDSLGQSFLKDPGDLAIADGHDLRVATRRVQDEYFLRFLNRTCRIDGERHADRDHDESRSVAADRAESGASCTDSGKPDAGRTCHRAGDCFLGERHRRSAPMRRRHDETHVDTFVTSSYSRIAGGPPSWQRPRSQ